MFTGEQSTSLDPAPYPSVTITGTGLFSLEKLKMILQRDRIRSAAAAVLRRGTDGEEITVFLNKQVAYAGHVSFCEPEGESPLGPIRLTIKTRQPARIIEWLTGGVKEREKR